jgi:hypothetical protein
LQQGKAHPACSLINAQRSSFVCEGLFLSATGQWLALEQPAVRVWHRLVQQMQHAAIRPDSLPLAHFPEEFICKLRVSRYHMTVSKSGNDIYAFLAYPHWSTCCALGM